MSAPPLPAVRIDAEARVWLAGRGAALTLRGSRRHGCCGGTAFVPVAEAGPPANPARYRVQRVDGIDVYVEDGVAPGPDPLEVALDTIWRWGRLRVDGVAIWMEDPTSPT
jgi:hypothetical protein